MSYRNRLTKTAPRTIWLQTEAEDCDIPFPEADLGAITWAAERIHSNDIEYTRADIGPDILESKLLDINEALQNALGDNIVGMERERIERLAADVDYYKRELVAKAERDRILDGLSMLCQQHRPESDY